MKKHETLFDLHTDPSHNGYRVRTDGTGKSWLEVPYGDPLGGHLATCKRLATVGGWPVLDRPAQRLTLLPTYAYDRLVVSGLRCPAPV